MLTAYFFRRHRSVQVAEDLAQETFLRLVRRVERCRASESARGYLFGIARHVSADAFRRARPAWEGCAILETVAAPQPDERLAAAREVIGALPPLQREILELRFQNDLSYAEIAEALRIPVGTVRSRLHAALGALRETMERQEKGTPS